jgi:1,2-diacylglycerol 3-beta-galactosyltransferase
MRPMATARSVATAAGPGPAPVPLLFLIGDTGGGHRSAASAVAQALHQGWPGRFAPVLRDPLRGPAAPPWLHAVIGLYGPAIRRAPWLWGLLWHGCGSARARRWARASLLAPADRAVARAVAAQQPAAIVVFHPLTTDAAVRARDRHAPGVPVITVITDLVTAHPWWTGADADRVVVPSAALAARCARGGLPASRVAHLGLPVAAEFAAGPPPPAERDRLRRALGLRPGRFLVVLTGGAEGSGGLGRRARAVLRRAPGADVAVICGRNTRLRRRLARIARRSGGALTVHGLVGNMADWLRAADVVAGKAGPGTIAEAACCAAPLLLTSRVPGQEDGNIELVTGAGAGRYAPRPRDLAAEVAALATDPAALASLRAASAGLGRPDAAVRIARMIADLAGGAPPPPATVSGRRTARRA